LYEYSVFLYYTLATERSRVDGWDDMYGNMGNTLEAETKQFDGVVEEVIL
jgi:hypothetical protein